VTGSTDPVELLERAIGYTRGTLQGVTDGMLGRPTPCAGWTLADLLSHMADSLDALTEASRGVIEIGPPPPAAAGVDVLRDKACHLLGAWSNPHATEARLGHARLRAGCCCTPGHSRSRSTAGTSPRQPAATRRFRSGWRPTSGAMLDP